MFYISISISGSDVEFSVHFIAFKGIALDLPIFFCIRFTEIVACIYDLSFARSACARRTRIALLFIFHTSFNCRRFIYLFSVFLVYIKISSLKHAFISHLFSFLSCASFSFKMCALMPVCLFCVRLFVCLIVDSCIQFHFFFGLFCFIHFGVTWILLYLIVSLIARKSDLTEEEYLMRTQEQTNEEKKSESILKA